MNRPFVFINIAMTADGKIDTFERKGAAISSQRDKERVDQLRASTDAIMIGGRTLLDEDPKLTVKSEVLREERVARGLSPHPIKVGVVTEAKIKADSQFLNIFGGESAPTMAAGLGLKRSEAIPLKLVEAEKWEDGGVLLKYHVVR